VATLRGTLEGSSCFISTENRSINPSLSAIFMTRWAGMSDTAKKDLVEAITALVKERRLCAQLLCKPYERGTCEATMARFVELQTTIEALERALVSEADFP
jgi:hypothetical protein